MRQRFRIQTDLRTLQGQSVVDLQPGHQLAHLPRPELLSCGHIDQILHYVVSAQTDRETHTHISTNSYLYEFILTASRTDDQQLLHVISQAINTVDHGFP